ncbi:MAG: DNA-directed RNA polymerase subunit B'' [Candidatus Parvarchaeota archaeon]|nr:DNA-directed RNA polymerase subunit B'' [Candidatus Jingweiarchaeum tengchongense]MCW1298196.1 DNA-directed RNA polymerase subunit B'' [Candidatus Jingweiarchaeum tengchongense]MCW1299994.1 DNA-directed RNA polymerase subunit B'' [Candidatus Jingweiarchaeum tengchongense]MCW1305016.1 DNA-directed RNA polymerase subunit B'' [Candidatus Jingweiarchaeum tengchongense]MCW1305457.1 DNA-directed RNA polymerase subunit B'' [Candidatus Jingweiarchaeum tengchongense]
MDKEKIILDAYFKDRSIIIHNIESFNKFIDKGMQRVVDEIGGISSDILPEDIQSLKIKFGKITVEKPHTQEAEGIAEEITPMQARLRNITYESPIILEMVMEKDGVEIERNNIRIGSIPIMLKSKYCVLNGKTEEELIEYGEDPNDPGGYFIINGTERIIVIIEDLAPNKVFTETDKTGPFPTIAKIFSEDTQYRIPHVLERSKDGIIYVSFARANKVPFAILMKALGITNEKAIVSAVSDDEKLFSDLYINLYETSEIKSEEDALDFIGRKLGVTYSKPKRVERACEVIDKFLFPHIGHSEYDRLPKAYFLAKTIKKLLLVSQGVFPEDDKDHYSNKRLRLCGDMLETLFRFSFRMLVGDMKYNLERLLKRGRLPTLQAITRAQLLTSRIRSALATGEWIGERHGISQHIDRLNHFATLSHLRRVVSLLTASRENFEARDLHPTQWGRLCSHESPEGPGIGLRKNLAITCEISTECSISDEELIQQLKNFGLNEIGGKK